MIIAKRYVDTFKPGDTIPDGHYNGHTIKQLLDAKLITVTKEKPALKLDGLKVAELRTLADGIGLVHKGLKKAELIKALEAAQ